MSVPHRPEINEDEKKNEKKKNTQEFPDRLFIYIFTYPDILIWGKAQGFENVRFVSWFSLMILSMNYDQ